MAQRGTKLIRDVRLLSIEVFQPIFLEEPSCFDNYHSLGFRDVDFNDYSLCVQLSDIDNIEHWVHEFTEISLYNLLQDKFGLVFSNLQVWCGTEPGLSFRYNGWIYQGGMYHIISSLVTDTILCLEDNSIVVLTGDEFFDLLLLRYGTSFGH